MRPYRRRGVLLTLVIIVMGIVGGLLSILMSNSVALRRDREILRVGASADAALESAVAYAHAHAGEWASPQRAGAMELDLAGMMPAHMTGSASLSFHGEGKVCHIRVSVQNTGFRAERESDVSLTPASAPAGE